MNRKLLYPFVFITGAGVTIVEITASRVLAPFFGTSLFVWANVIGITLIALALGYAYGGRIADKHPQTHRLMVIVLTAGVYSALIPVLVQWIAQPITLSFAGLGASFAFIVASFFVSVLLFFPPIFLLGMVSPYAIRLASVRVEDMGTVAGSIFSASTVGSILGVFLPAFVLIPYLGVRETFFLASVLLIGIASIGLVRRAPWVFAFLIIPILLLFVLQGDAIRGDEAVLLEQDTAYQYVRVLEDNLGVREMRINDGLGVQSMWHPDTIFFDSYFDYYSVLPYLLTQRESLDVLLIGLAGGTISRQYDAIHSENYDLHIDGVEIDPSVVSIAREYFELDRDVLDVHIADGRTFLAQTDKQYDIVIIDAYSQQIYIPAHLTTQEFFTEVQEHVKDDGLVALNVNAFRDDAELLQRLDRTLASVFDDVRVQRIPEFANLLVLASDGELGYNELASRVPSELALYAGVVEDALPSSFPNERGKILTDNRAPVELLTESMIFDYLFNE